MEINTKNVEKELEQLMSNIQKIDEYKKRLEASCSKVDDFQSRVDNKINDLEEVEKKHLSNYEKLISQVETFNNKVDSVEKSLENIKKAEISLDENIKINEKGLNLADEQLNTSKVFYNETIDQINHFKDNLERIETIKENITHLYDRIEEYHSQIKEYQEKMNGTINELDAYKDDVKKCNDNFTVMNKEVKERISEENSSIKNTLEEMMNSIEKKASEIVLLSEGHSNKLDLNDQKILKMICEMNKLTNFLLETVKQILTVDINTKTFCESFENIIREMNQKEVKSSKINRTNLIFLVMNTLILTIIFILLLIH